MSELLISCPICGKKPKRYICKRNLEDWYDVIYECRDKGHTVTVEGENDLEAIEVWNTRYERTCEMHHAEWDDGQCVWGCKCTECGHRFTYETGKIWNYCPKCGARIVNA